MTMGEEEQPPSLSVNPGAAPSLSVNPGAWAAAQIQQSEVSLDNFDEKTRKALEGFEKAVRPAGLAASGADGETIRSRAAKLLAGDCRGLINAGEVLLSAVAKLVEAPVIVMLLQKLPKLLTRQALMIALSDVTPELLDRQWLRRQVDDLRAKQVASTTTYLQELGSLRSHLRHVAAAEAHLRNAFETPTPPQSKRGSKADIPAGAALRRHSVLKKAGKAGQPDRRASVSDTKEEIAVPQMGRQISMGRQVSIGRQTSNADDEPPRTSLSGSVSGSPLQRKGRKSLTMTGAAAAAMAVARSQAFGTKPPNEEVADVGIEFAEVHHYMWDAAEFLDQATQVLVCKVITEKLQCFKTQKEATTIAELAHLCKRMESYLKGTALEDHEKELSEVKTKLFAREEEVSSLVERLQGETSQNEQKERGFLTKLQQQERLRDNLQRELVDTQAQLAAMTAQNQDLTKELGVYKDSEASVKKQSAAFAKSRGRILTGQKPGSGNDADSPLEDFFARMMPDLVQHLTKELKDQSLKNQIMPVVRSLHQTWKACRTKSQQTAEALEDSEREAAEASKKMAEMEAARQKEKEAADAKVQSMKDRAERAEKNVVELQSNFMDKMQQAPAFVSLREDYEICRCELEQTIKQLRAVQEEYEEKFAEQEADRTILQEEHKKQVQKLQGDLQEVVESQLHPAQVAQLRSDLKRAQHESQALTNTNNMLKDSLASLQKKLLEAERRGAAAPGVKEEVGLLRDTCSRSVFSRLYEDAVRRSDIDQPDAEPSHARSWAGSILELRSRPHSANTVAATPRPLSAEAPLTPRRSVSEPPVRIVSPTALRDMLKMNALDLKHTLKESLFQHPIRLPLSSGMPATPRNLPGKFGESARSASPSQCVTPTVTNVDFRELSMAAQSAVGQKSPPRRRRSSPLPSPSVSGRTLRSPNSEDATGHRQVQSVTPTNFGMTSPRMERLRAISRPPTPEKTPRRRLIDGGPETLQPLTETSQAETEPTVQPTEPAGKAPPKPWSPRIAAKSRQANESPAGKMSPLPPAVDRSSGPSPETNPRPLPRQAATLLPTVRPKSAKPVQKTVAFSCSTPRPMTCGL